VQVYSESGFSNKIAFFTTGDCKLSQPEGTGYDNRAGAAVNFFLFFLINNFIITDINRLSL
jgi:hypothetical protein